ncbi:4-oxalocrotonate decarboxylase [Rhodococcus sp. BP-252]|uniref:2-keto-4-pentenoate hydratase n=1 Tax=unclassified Rhodococcus (in: high G+C Gram-positive bacteria) TaxID=192944 RepID=UPI001C9BB365|nr:MULTISPECIES: fumarylacetoacetate hydrolase family protein [unclassified Rhodococcus (in: high G+C Gram-positive bacteria)]MBY6414387.1 4-oxalocrotonate decarboxylase [Rhodococcus sp. BP-320]MBY6419524.1 4-oxalocrotonate decarboxylase [Rhodococcus sp. BP-321]MBY6424035.1 4-oxalocrotonate decarboxylase [Rhodococcus sp. BP-324]MBY6429246.1 4-oxalocrotonate decarboxylase [Rhodococcus sp. BP-323]MBY6434205.1 4-oxalocrotonate decarboxylase [Rhodococcus sp. BP-322]
MKAKMLDRREIDVLAGRLDDARVQVLDVPSLADDVEIHIDDAYRIQDELVARYLRRGEALVGVKLGFTSKAKMAQMGVSEVIVGRLTDAMSVDDGGRVELHRFIHPKIEPEVAYRLALDVDLDDPTVDVESCVDAVAPALEIIDSRYRDFRFTYTDVVADNTSAAAYVIGPWQPMRAIGDLPVRLEAGAHTVDGSTEAILDDPINALHSLLEVSRRRRIPLRPGDVILAGAATAAVPLTAGLARCEIDGLGVVSVEVTA